MDKQNVRFYTIIIILYIYIYIYISHNSGTLIQPLKRQQF